MSGVRFPPPAPMFPTQPPGGWTPNIEHEARFILRRTSPAGPSLQPVVKFANLTTVIPNDGRQNVYSQNPQVFGVPVKSTRFRNTRLCDRGASPRAFRGATQHSSQDMVCTAHVVHSCRASLGDMGCGWRRSVGCGAIAEVTALAAEFFRSTT